ncbi:MAG: hypothetical protein MZV64_35550 [Ignavibacteriales bacterium]|nr:hypothetical protein [Ignavibacteriales bacterium]
MPAHMHSPETNSRRSTRRISPKAIRRKCPARSIGFPRATSYFAVALIPGTVKTEGAFLDGARQHAPDNGVLESYVVALKMPFKGGSSESTPLRVFLGPIQHNLLKSCRDRLGEDHESRMGVAHPSDLRVSSPSALHGDQLSHPQLGTCHHHLFHHHQDRPPSADEEQYEFDAENAEAPAAHGRASKRSTRTIRRR